jgi:PAS domain S-box-containing protein
MNLAGTNSLNRTLGGAIAAIALVAVVSSAAILVTVRQVDTATEARARSNQVIRNLDAFRTAMLNQETGTRGFLITGRESSLEPYQMGRLALENALTELHGLIDDDPRLEEAANSARTWQREDGEVVAGSATDPALKDQAARVESAGKGKRLFDDLREKLGGIEQEQQAELARQNEIVARARQNTSIALWTGGLLVLAICLAVGIAINRLIARPLIGLADVMRRLAQRDLTVEVIGTDQRNEVGAMARAVEVFKSSLIELDRTSLLRATADTLPALVGYIDRGRNIGFLNEEFARWFELPGNDVASLTGRSLSEVFSGDSFPGAASELDAALRGVEKRFEHRLTRRGSGPRDVQAYYRPHRGLDGQIAGAVTLLTDITEHKSLEQRLARQTRDLTRSNEELEQFAYVASHDLKAPLRGIDNLVTWIEEDLEGSLTGDTRTNMGLLKSRVRRLEALLDDLLAYSRAGRGDTTIQRVDIRALIAELADLITPPPGFAIAAGEKLPTIETARAPLLQTLQEPDIQRDQAPRSS